MANVTREHQTFKEWMNDTSNSGYFMELNNTMNCSVPNWTDQNESDEHSVIDQITLRISVLEEISSGLWKFFPPILFFIGMTGNILILAVLRYMRFWQKPPLFFLAVLALSDSLVLCTGLSRYWAREVFDYDLRTFSNWGCKVNLFMIYWSMHLSSWTLVCIVTERFVKTNFPLHYSRVVSVRRCAISVGLIFTVLAAIDLHFFWTNGLIENGTDCSSLTEEYFKFEEFIFTFVDLSVLSVVPFFIMVILNILIIRVVKQSRNLQNATVRDSITHEKMKKFDVKLTRMLLLTSIYFLLTTIPISVYFIVDSFVTADGMTAATMDIAWSVCYIFQFTNYTMNFYLYNISNQTFRKNLKRMFGCSSVRNDYSIRGSHDDRTSAAQTRNTGLSTDQGSTKSNEKF